MSYNIEKISNMRIHELRDFARSVGVNSPTTMKKEQLIEEITEKLSGLNEEDVEQANKIKENQDIDFFSVLVSDNYDFLKDLLKSSQNNESTQKEEKNISAKEDDTYIYKKDKFYEDDNPYAVYDTNELVTFKFTLRQNYAAEYHPDAPDVVTGYLDMHQDGFGIVRVNDYMTSTKDVFLPQTFIKKYNLQKGDCVTGNVKKLIPNKPRVMYEIISIDGNVKNKRNFDDYPYEKMSESYYLEKFKIDFIKGERLYISHMNIADAVDFAQELAEENSTYIKFINIKAKPEDNYQSNQKIDIINLPFDADESEIILTTNLVFERIKREFENNKSNVLFIYNFSEYLRILNASYQGVYGNSYFDKKSINKIMNILKTAKYFDKNKNISIVCVDIDGIDEDVSSVLSSQLKHAFNKFIDTIERNK